MLKLINSEKPIITAYRQCLTKKKKLIEWMNEINKKFYELWKPKIAFFEWFIEFCFYKIKCSAFDGHDFRSVLLMASID